MKKTLLSATVIAAFIFYSFLERRQFPGEVTRNLSPIPTGTSDTPSADTNPPITGSTPAAADIPPPAPDTVPPAGQAGNIYKNGDYTGDVADAFYGNIQVKAVIRNGRIADVQFLQYPNDRMQSMMINMRAMPILKQEAIQAQNAQVDIVSGATDTSRAFIESLSSAIQQAI